MENELSTLNVIHWECKAGDLTKPGRVDVQAGVSGMWLEIIPVLHFKWRIMCYVGNTIAFHFVAENNFTVPDLSSFNETKMKDRSVLSIFFSYKYYLLLRFVMSLLYLLPLSGVIIRPMIGTDEWYRIFL